MYRANRQHLQSNLFSDLDNLSAKARRRLEESWAGVFYREFFCRPECHVSPSSGGRVLHDISSSCRLDLTPCPPGPRGDLPAPATPCGPGCCATGASKPLRASLGEKGSPPEESRHQKT